MNLIIMILLISLLILVHEAGHFLAAKFFKIKVDKFGFGLPFGPTLFKKKIGETEFLIHSFLLGGYVSFPDDDENSDLPKDSPLRFKNKPIYQRAIVISAGVFSNLVCAFVLVLLTGFVWGSLPSNKYEIKVLKVLTTATPSTKRSGIRPNDIIYSVNGSRADLPIVLTKYLTHSKAFDGFISEETVGKKEKELEKLNPKIKPNEKIKKDTIVKLPPFEEEKPLKFTYDQIVGFEQYKSNEKELTNVQTAIRDNLHNKKTYKVTTPTTLKDIAAAASDTYKPIFITVLRDDKKIELKKIYVDENGMMGIEKQVKELYVKNKTPMGLIKNTINYVDYNTRLMTYGLGKILTGKIPVQEMHGIVAITKIGSDVIQYQGLFKGVLLTAIISLNLAIINLLPIPALDGGHLFFLIIEKIRGKALNEKITETIGNFFFYILIVLMVLIVFNDIFALVTKQI